MKNCGIIKNAKIGYTLATSFFFVACTLFVADWKFLGSAAAAVALGLTINTASAHGHLKKRKSDQAKPF